MSTLPSQQQQRLTVRELTEANRTAQQIVARRVIADVLATFGLLDPKNLDQTTAGWLRVTTPIVTRYADVSARVAADYMTELRQIDLDLDVDTPYAPLLRTPSAEQIATSLRVTGPIGLKKSLRGGILDARALDTTKTRVTGAAMRLALDGGRQTILDTLAADPQARGWRRITSANSCKFCQMLAGRGAVYAADTVRFAAHDHCRCSAEPVYGGDAVNVAQEFTPSQRRLSEQQRQAANQRARDWIAVNL